MKLKITDSARPISAEKIDPTVGCRKSWRGGAVSGWHVSCEKLLGTGNMVVIMIFAATLASATGTSDGFQGTGQMVQFDTIRHYEQATGRKITDFREAPMIKSMVENGSVLSIRDRLPDEPPVIQPADWIGVHGRTMTSPDDGSPELMASLLSEFPTTYDPQHNMFLPNVFTNLEWSENLRTLSFTVRRGIRWSDGELFGLDDVEFWFRTVTNNPELSPDDGRLSKMAEIATITKIADNSIVLSFATPNTALFDFTTRWPDIPYRPSHYLKRFHPSYTDPDVVADLARDSGFLSWQDKFIWETSLTDNPDIPTISPWKYEGQGDDKVQVFVRNPYYWKIDVVGNQLPYFDEVRRLFVEDKEASPLNALSGEDGLTEYRFDVFPDGLLNAPHGLDVDAHRNSAPSWSSSIALLGNLGGGYAAEPGMSPSDRLDPDDRPRASRMFVAESDNHQDKDYRAHGAVVFTLKAISDRRSIRYRAICEGFIAALEPPDESVAINVQMVTAWPLNDAAAAGRLNASTGDWSKVCVDAVAKIDTTLSAKFLDIALEERNRPVCLRRSGPFLIAWSNHHDEVLIVDMTNTDDNDFADVFVEWNSDIVDSDGWKQTWLEQITGVVDRTASVLLWWVPGNPVPEGC